MRAFLIGCAVVLMAGASGVQAEASKKEEARCEGTRTFKKPIIGMGVFTTNDLPGCPKGGLLEGTDKPDKLAGEDGADEVRGLGGSDQIFDGSGDDVIYGGDGDDFVYPDEGNDVIYGGDGNDELGGNDGQRDKLYCGAGKDRYFADKPPDYVDSSCEKQLGPPSHWSGDDVAIVSTTSATSSASASPVPLPQSGGPAILLLAAALLLGSGILTYAILRRR